MMTDICSSISGENSKCNHSHELFGSITEHRHTVDDGDIPCPGGQSFLLSGA